MHDNVFPRTATVFRYNYGVLSDKLPTDQELTSFKYWGKCQHLPHHPENWAHVSQDDIDKSWDAARDDFKKHGIHPSGNKAKDMDVYYACEDYERQQRLYKGDWFYLGCIATLELDGKDFVSSSLWGIESDADASYKREIVNEQIAEVLQMCPVEIIQRRATLDKLNSILASSISLS